MTSPPLALGIRRDDQSPVTLPPTALLRHVMALGSSGSGKTVLAKVVVEEALRRGIPAICIDPQGDLASLALVADPAELAARGVDPELSAWLRERVDPVVFTPASRKGIPICADPVERGLGALEPAERLQAFSRTAAMVVTLLGYELDGDEGAGLAAAFDSVLGEMAGAGRPAESLAALAARLAELEAQDFAGLERLVDPKRLRTACQRLARLDVGARRLLFHEGIPIDIDVLTGRSERAAPPPGKVRLSIVYLNTLHAQEDKDFFVAALVSRLYGWMLRHPASEPQLLFYLDEVSPYVPPVRKPAAKEPLVLLFKQARKYGVCCLMATQNPGDVDYKAMAQFGTWGLGRLTTRQDLKKLAPAIKSLAPTASDTVLDALPALKPGEFTLLAPDHFPAPCPLRTRWLATRHETCDEDRIEALTSDELRRRFTALEAAPSPAAPAPPVTTASAPTPPVATPRPPGLRPAAERSSPPAAEPSASTASEPPRRPVTRTQPMAAVPAMAAPTAGAPTTTSLPTPPAAAPAPVVVPLAAAAAPAPGPTVEELRAQHLELAAGKLAQGASMSAVEFAAVAGVGERKARALLAELVEAGLARAYKEGRAGRWFATGLGARPDLGLPATVLAVLPRVDAAAVQQIAAAHARQPLLGLVGGGETLERAEPVHRLVHRVDFSEKVPRPVLAGLFGTATDERLGSVYLHPTTLALLLYHPSHGIAFAPRPTEYASDVVDFDGAVSFAEVAPASLTLTESDFASGRTEHDLRTSLTQRYRVSVGRITPVFVPLWRIVLRSGAGSGYRLVHVDALTGRLVEWP